MRKRIIDTHPSNAPEAGKAWLAVEQLATVEVSSETEAHPIEGALMLGSQVGWRASQPGEQLIRLIFDTPQPLKRIWLHFIEHDVERAQEFVLRWSPDNGQTFYEIVRQQWNFNLQTAPEEIEDYHVDLPGVVQLELCIDPDRSGSGAVATLAQLRLAAER
jgi:hypothetical protein